MIIFLVWTVVQNNGPNHAEQRTWFQPPGGVLNFSCRETQRGTWQERVWGVPRRGIKGAAASREKEREGQRSGGSPAVPEN